MNAPPSPVAPDSRPAWLRRVLRWPRRLLWALLILAVLLVALRIALPVIIRHQIVARLDAVEGYAGEVGDIDLALFRGAYVIEDIAIRKVEGVSGQPFFSARRIDFSIAWRELFRGHLRSEIYAEAPALAFVNAGSDAQSQTGAGRAWQDVIQDIFPIDITLLEITDGDIRYADTGAEPPVDLRLTSVEGTATGLRNRRDAAAGDTLPASISATADTAGGGRLDLDVRLAPLADELTLQLAFDLRGLDLRALNNFLLSTANVDVHRGTLDLYVEVAAADGAYEGYAKPFLNDLDFKSEADEDKPLGQRIWESLVAGAALLVKNDERDQVATRIPFSGRFEESQVGIWTTIRTLFRHGFIQALSENYDNDITLTDAEREAAKATTPDDIEQGPQHGPHNQ